MTAIIDHGTTRDGLIQHRRRWHAGDRARAAVLLLHGIAEHSGRYEHVGRRLAAAGFDTIAIDHRGYGRSGGRRGHVDSWAQFTHDVEDQMAQVRTLGLPVVLLGHSMGGLIATRYVVDERIQPDLLVLSGPALGAVIPGHLRAMAPILSRFLPTLEIREEGDPSQLSTDPTVGETFYADPLRVPYPTARLGAELIRAMSEACAAIEKVTMPTYVVHGGDDELVPAAATEIFETLPNAERVVHEGLRHEVFNEPTGLEIVDDVIAWIERQLSTAPRHNI